MREVDGFAGVFDVVVVYMSEATPEDVIIDDLHL